MKQSCLVLAALALHLTSYGQDFYSYYQGRRQFYQPHGNQLVVRLPEGDPTGRALASLRADARVLAASEVNPHLGTVFLTYDTAQVRDARAFALEMRQALPGARSVSPVLALRGAKAQRPTCAWLDEVLVRPLPGKSQSQLLALARELGLALERPLAYDSATLVFRLAPTGGTNALEAANRLHESGLVAFAEPNWLMFVKPNNATFWPNDPRLGEAWHLRNTGQNRGLPDADIDADEAWAINTGCPAVRIAVLGNGVDRAHPDLAANILNGFDVLGQNNNGDATGNHETLVAGVAAAVGNNNLGAAGVAYNCRIVPIRFAPDDLPVTLANMAVAFNWAWQQNRSDVILMSWSGGSPANVLDAAIGAAITQGRPRPNGPLGCVVVIITGNDFDSTVEYPSNLPGVMSVGATDNQDKRADFSNYGTDLDVVAPGVGIFGTDRTGVDGYNPGGDFVAQPGTSFAAPQVAGIAALLLSVNPNLTQQQVRDLIELTCDKVGLDRSWPGYQTTAGRPNGTWHEEMGYGRVNAANALRRALAGTTGMTGPTVVCVGNGPGTFAIPNPQLPNPPTWTASPNLQVTSNGNSATVVQVGNGPGWVESTWPSPCGGNPIRLRRDVVVGPPLPPLDFQGYTPGIELCPNSSYSFVALAQPYNYAVTVVSGVGTAIYNAFSQALTVNIQSTTAPLIVQVQVTHPNFPSCPSASFNLTFYPKDCTDPCLRPLVTYPNPSSGRLVVGFEEVEPGRVAPPPDPCRPSRIQVYNRFGQVVRVVELVELMKKGPVREVVLDTQGLPAGVYFLHIVYEDRVEKQQIVIE